MSPIQESVKVPQEAIRQLFTEARTHSAWQPKKVEESILRSLYEIMKWGPTSANTNPMRILFVKSEKAKAQLISTLHEGNIEKTKAAPVTAILAWDERFYEEVPRLFPYAPQLKDMFASNKAMSDRSAFQNASLQGGYFILAARALGLDCGPMAGFDNAQVDEAFFKGSSWKSNFLCNLGYGDAIKLHPRGPRLSFDEACKII